MVKIRFFIAAIFTSLLGCEPFISEADIPILGSTQLRKADLMTMVYVPAGSFLMGSTEEQIDAAFQTCMELLGDERYCSRDAFEDEQPAHVVSLDAFWFDQVEVTNERFAAFLNLEGNQSENGVYWLELGTHGLIEPENGNFHPKKGFENYPVSEVSWYGAAAYCSWVGGRLPTEAEWEYAARGPENHIFPWGDEFDGCRVNFCDSNCNNDWQDPDCNDGYVELAPVGSYPDGASWCGALDMAGNVWEWVGDWYDSDYYLTCPSHNPTGPMKAENLIMEDGTCRALRGGSWYDQEIQLRSMGRQGEALSSHRVRWVGFRCVMPEIP